MSSFRRMLTLAVVCLASLGAAQVPDQAVAERVLGSHWRQMARASEMIFSGTVLEIAAQPVTKGRPLPLMLTKFRVDRAIVGVRRGEAFTVREWTGALAMQRPVRRGERVLIFLYAPSRLGLTSPVGGRMGQVMLDSRGEIAARGEPRDFLQGPQLAPAAEAAVEYQASAAQRKSCPPENRYQISSLTPSQGRLHPTAASQVLPHCATLPRGPRITSGSTLDQLERAIRAARSNSAVNPGRDHVRPTSGN